MKNFKILALAITIFASSTAVLASFKNIKNENNLEEFSDNDSTYNLKTQYDPAIDAIDNDVISSSDYTSPILNNRVRILTDNNSYKSAVIFAEKFANNSKFNTPVVESVGVNTLLEFFSESKNSGDIIVSKTKLNPIKFNVYNNFSISEVRVISNSGEKYFVYAKDLSTQSPFTVSLFKNFVIDDIIKTYSL